MQENNTALQEAAGCIDIPQVHIVFEGDIDNINITVNYFREDVKGE